MNCPNCKAQYEHVMGLCEGLTEKETQLILNLKNVKLSGLYKLTYAGKTIRVCGHCRHVYDNDMNLTTITIT